MDNRSGEVIDAVVRQMLDGMRNAHLQMVIGDPSRAIECLEEAAAAHHQLAILFRGNAEYEAIAGRILFRVIEQRMESLRSLAGHCLESPLPASDVVAFVAEPLQPANIDEGDTSTQEFAAPCQEMDPAPTQMPPIG